MLRGLLSCLLKPADGLPVVSARASAAASCFAGDHGSEPSKFNNTSLGQDTSRNAPCGSPCHRSSSPQRLVPGTLLLPSTGTCRPTQTEGQRERLFHEVTASTSTATARDSLICGNALSAITVVNRNGVPIYQNPASILYFGDQVTLRHRPGEAADKRTFLVKVFQLEPEKLEHLLHDVRCEECGRWRGVVRVAPNLLSGELRERPNTPPPPLGGAPWQRTLQSPTPHVVAAPGVAANGASAGPSPKSCTATLQICTVEFEEEAEEGALTCLGTTGRFGAPTPPRHMETHQLARDEFRASDTKEANQALIATTPTTRMPVYGAVGMAFRSPGVPAAYTGCEAGGSGQQSEIFGHARATSGSCAHVPTRDCMSRTSRGTAAIGAAGGMPTTSSSNVGRIATAYSLSRPSLPTDAGFTSRHGYANGCTGRLSMMGHRHLLQLDPGTLNTQEGCASKDGPDYVSASGNGHAAHLQLKAPAAAAAAAAAATAATCKYICPLASELGDIPESAAASTGRTYTGMRWESIGGNPLATSTFGLALGRQYEDLPAAATPLFALASIIPSPSSVHHHPATCHTSGATQGGVRVVDMGGQRRSTSQRTLSIGHSAIPRGSVTGFGRFNSTVQSSSAVPIENPGTAPGLNAGGRAISSRADSTGSRVLTFASSLRNAPMAAQILAEGSITTRANSLRRSQEVSQSPARLEATLSATAAAECGRVAASLPALSRSPRFTDHGLQILGTAPHSPSLSAPGVNKAGAAGGAQLAASGASTPSCLLPGSGVMNEPWDTCGTVGRCTSTNSGGTLPMSYFAVQPDHDGSCGASNRNGAAHRLGRCSMGAEQGHLLAPAIVQELMAKEAEGSGAGANGAAASMPMEPPSPAARPGTTGGLTAGPDLPTVDWPLTSMTTSGSGREAVGTAGHPDCPSCGEQQQAAHAAQQASGSGMSQQSQTAQQPQSQDGERQQVEPQDGASEGCECWHEVWATRAVDPVTGQEVIVVSQHDVTAKVVAERHLAMVMEAEHRLLEQLFPKHILTHITEEWIAEAERAVAAVAPGNGPQGEGGGGGGGRVRKSSAKSNRWRPVVRDCNALATWHPQVTLLFADIKGFTPMCEQVSPRAVMTMLNDLFSRFDSMLDKFGVFKVETIGDCYFVAGGLIHEDEDGMAAVRDVHSKGDPLHAERVLMFAKAMLAAATEVRMPTTGQRVQVRIGIHSGPVVSGVVGTRMPRFCLFGDTVNTTSRMESTGVPGAIHASAAAYALLRSEAWEPTGGVEVKGKGSMQTYLWRPLLGEEEDGTERKLPACAAAAAAALAKVVGAARPLPLAASHHLGEGGNADQQCAAEGEGAVADVTGGGAGVGRTAGTAAGGAEPTVMDAPAPAQGLPGGEGCVDAAQASMITAAVDASSNIGLHTRGPGRTGEDATMLTQSERLVSLLINYKA